MLFDQWGYRTYTREECALLEAGARRLAGDLIESDSLFSALVEAFDRMTLDEKLVALHSLCVNAAFDEEPKGREMWLDATMMAVLEHLKAQVEIAFDLLKEGEGIGDREVAELTRLILASRLSHDCDIAAIQMLPYEERSELDNALLQMHDTGTAPPEISQEVLLEILEGYEVAFFYNWDFLNSEATLGLSPPAYAKLVAQMGIEPGFHVNTAPSCSPQAVREARQFLFED